MIVASRKLCPYFQAHMILVMINQPLRKAMGRPDAAGRMVQWAIELSQFDVDYRPRIAIKSQALVDFVAEFITAEQDPESDYWTMHTDSSAASGMGGVRVILSSPEKDVLKYGVQLQLPATNNEAEYEAVLTGLLVAKALGVRNLKVNSDSKLVTGQMNNEYEALISSRVWNISFIYLQISETSIFIMHLFPFLFSTLSLAFYVFS